MTANQFVSHLWQISSSLPWFVETPSGVQKNSQLLVCGSYIKDVGSQCGVGIKNGIKIADIYYAKTADMGEGGVKNGEKFVFFARTLTICWVHLNLIFLYLIGMFQYFSFNFLKACVPTVYLLIFFRFKSLWRTKLQHLVKVFMF